MNLFFCGILISFSFTPILYATTIHVPADQPTIQDGINAAVNGDTILVAPGTYRGIGNRAVDFMGKAIVVRSSHGALQTTIDCEKMNRGLRIWRGEGPDSRFEGLTIANGSLHVNGGGIEIKQSSPIISDCIIRGCDAPNGGGILVYDNSSPIIRNCIILNNTGSSFAGGMLISGGASLVENCIVIGNTVLSFDGGGIYCEAGDETIIRNCLITGNHAPIQGGGVYCIHSNMVLKDCTIVGNSCDQSAGGGIYLNRGSPTIYQCLITNNNAEKGGGIGISGSTLDMSNCIIVNNTASEIGGGAYCQYYWTDVTFRNCTFSMNTAVEEGGAIRCLGSNINLINSVCWNDYAPAGREIYVGSGEMNISYSDIQWGEDSVYVKDDAILNWLEGNITDNPMFADTTNGDYHLQIGSPCIDAGDSSILDSCKPPGKGRARSDMGAYGGEFNCWASEPALGRTEVFGPQPPGTGQELLYPTRSSETE